MPHLIIIAGPNGAGKSTAAPALLKEALHVDNFVNADVIAQGLCAYQPEKAAIKAGCIMLDRIHTLANEKANFAFETTLDDTFFDGDLHDDIFEDFQIVSPYIAHVAEVKNNFIDLNWGQFINTTVSNITEQKRKRMQETDARPI